jgi:hypothetical protein
LPKKGFPVVGVLVPEGALAVVVVPVLVVVPTVVVGAVVVPPELPGKHYK